MRDGRVNWLCTLAAVLVMRMRTQKVSGEKSV